MTCIEICVVKFDLFSSIHKINSNIILILYFILSRGVFCYIITLIMKIQARSPSLTASQSLFAPYTRRQPKIKETSMNSNPHFYHPSELKLMLKQPQAPLTYHYKRHLGDENMTNYLTKAEFYKHKQKLDRKHAALESNISTHQQSLQHLQEHEDFTKKTLNQLRESYQQALENVQTEMTGIRQDNQHFYEVQTEANDKLRLELKQEYKDFVKDTKEDNKALKVELNLNFDKFKEGMESKYSEFKKEMKDEYAQFKEENKSDFASFKSYMENQFTQFNNERKEEYERFKKDMEKKFEQTRNEMKDDFNYFRNERKNDFEAHKNEVYQFKSEMKDEFNLLREDMNDFRKEMKANFDSLREEMNDFKKEIKADFDSLREEMNDFKKEIRSEINAFREEVNTKIDNLLKTLKQRENRMLVKFGLLFTVINIIASIILHFI